MIWGPSSLKYGCLKRHCVILGRKMTHRTMVCRFLQLLFCHRKLNLSKLNIFGQCEPNVSLHLGTVNVYCKLNCRSYTSAHVKSTVEQ